jgi:hypothetical protein
MNISEELDRSFGDGPPLPPVEARVAAGRRALLQRRVATGVAGLAAAAMLAIGWYAAAPGGPPKSKPTTDPTLWATQGPTADPSERPWPRGELIRYLDGVLQVRPGVTVHEHIENPYDFEPPSLSDALDITYKGTRQWLMIEKRPRPHGVTSSSATPSNGWASFADYVADQVDLNVGGDGESGWPQTFELDAEGRVVPTRGTTVLDRTGDPRLGPGFAPPGTATGAAVVTVAGDETSYFVVWRVIDGSLDVITTPPDEVTGATFEELLTYARAQYASGEGLR